MKVLTSKIKEYISPIALAFAFCIYAPIEIYVLNKSEFWFGISDMCGMVIITMLLVFAVVSIPYLLLKGIGREIYNVIVSTVTICVYIQGNFIGLKVGVMNGADIAWKEYLPQMVINLMIWMAIILAAVYIYTKNKVINRICPNITAVILGIQIITLSVLLFQYRQTEQRDTEITTLTDKGLYSTSKEDNIIVFILDMFDADYFDKILEDEPEWGEKLEGFTLYRNCTGTYSTTSYSLAHIYTGRIFLNEMPQRDWVNDVAKDRLYVDELRDSGYKLYYYSTIDGTIPERLAGVSENRYEGICKVNDHVKLAVNMYKVAAFKYLPDCVKPLLWLDGYEFEALRECEDANIYMSDNARFRDGIRSAEWTESDEKTIKYIYTIGSHYPYRIDRDGNDVHMGEVTAIECARGVLSIVEEYLDHLREAGTYDNTSIIITADHGYYWDGTLQSPVMLVKPKGNSGILDISDAPVCQADVAGTILELSGLSNYEAYGDSMLHIDGDSLRERRFYQYYLNDGADKGNYRLIEYSVDPTGRERECFNLTGNEYTTTGTLIDHYMYCETCQNGVAEIYDRDYPRLVHYKSRNYPEYND